MAVLREAPEGRSKVLPVEETRPIVDAMLWLQSACVQVLVGLRHPEEPCLRPSRPVEPGMELRPPEGGQEGPKARLQPTILGDELMRRVAGRSFVLVLRVDDRE